jgi:hypothetical protein
VLSRVERAAGHADDPRDSRLSLQERDQAKTERAGRSGDGNGQA